MAGLSCKTVDVVFLDSHGREGLGEGLVAEQVERDIDLFIDRISGTENDAVKPAMSVGEFSLGVLRMDDGDERHGRGNERPERRRRRENRREIFELAEC